MLASTFAYAPLFAAEPESEAQSVVVRGTPPARSASETIVDEHTLKAAPHENASELLVTVPGVFVSQHSGEGKAHQLFFRGFDAVHGQDLEIWAGGAPVNEVSHIHGQGYADLHFLIPEVVREIRSLPGTYDPRQGDFAVAGSLELALGYDAPGISAQASAGSFGAKRWFFAYHPPKTAPENFAAFEFEASDGFGPAREARHGTGIAQAVYDFGSGTRSRVLASTYAAHFESAGVLRAADVEGGLVDRFETYDPEQGGTSARHQLVFELARERELANGPESERWSVSPYVVLRRLALRSNFTGYATSPEGDSIEQRNDAVTAGAVASYSRPFELFSPRDWFEVGAVLRSDRIHQTQHRRSLRDGRVTDDASSPGVDAVLSTQHLGGYLDAELHPLRRVTLRGGLRADGLFYRALPAGARARSAAGARVSPRGTLSVALVPGAQALASYGEGFRSPQARSLVDDQPLPFTRVRSAELGIRYRDTRRFAASLAVYRTTLSDDLVFDHTTARSARVPATSRRGLSMNLGAQPTDWFTSAVSFTYAQARFEADGAGYRTGDAVPYVPELVTRSDLALRPQLATLSGYPVTSHFGLGLSPVARRPLPYGGTARDVFLTDAGVSLRFRALQLGAEVFNLFDAEWYDGEFVYPSAFGGTPSVIPIRHVTVGAPRAFLFSLTLFL